MIERRPLSLHVPEPPGGRAASPISPISISRAGAVRRPPVDVSPHEIHDLAYAHDPRARRRGRRGRAVGRTLDADELRKGLRDMMTTRAFDARMLIAQRQGKTSFYMQCLGEEAIALRPRAWRSSRATCASRPTASRAC